MIDPGLKLNLIVLKSWLMGIEVMIVSGLKFWLIRIKAMIDPD